MKNLKLGLKPLFANDIKSVRHAAAYICQPGREE